MEHVGELVKQDRVQRALSQEALASKAEVSPATIVRLERGEIRRPRTLTLTKLAQALGVNPGRYVWFWPELPEEKSGAPDRVGTGFTAVFERAGEWWLGYVEELPGANAQERTLQEARESLREAIGDILEANRELTRTEFEGRDVVREPIGA